VDPQTPHKRSETPPLVDAVIGIPRLDAPRALEFLEHKMALFDKKLYKNKGQQQRNKTNRKAIKKKRKKFKLFKRSRKITNKKLKIVNSLFLEAILKENKLQTLPNCQKKQFLKNNNHEI
jgi:uncharacterized protein with gpF-like domain